MADLAKGLKTGFGEFFFAGYSEQGQTAVKPEEKKDGTSVGGEPLTLALSLKGRGDVGALSGVVKNSGGVPVSKVFSSQVALPGSKSLVDEKWQLQFNEETNPVATRLFHAFLAQGITPEQILGRKDASDTVVTASDVLSYLDQNFKRPLVQRALKSPEIGFTREPWLSSKRKIFPQYNTKEFKALSFTQKIAYVNASKAAKSTGEKQLHHLKNAIWFHPAKVENHRALGKAAVANGDFVLAQIAFHNAAQLDPKGPTVAVAMQAAILEDTQAKLATIVDPLQKQYYGIRLSLVEGNLPKAKLQMLDFKDATLNATGETLVAQREEVRGMLRALALKDIAELTTANETLKAQRLSNFEMNFYDEKTATGNSALLALVKDYVQAGRVDTLEEGLALFQDEHERLQKDFWKNPSIQKDWSVTLPFNKLKYGSEEAKAEKKAAFELIAAFKANPTDPQFLAKDAFPGLPYVKLEGGLLNIPSSQAPAARVVIGKAGGFIRMGELTYSFKPSETERVVILTPGFLLAPQLKRHVDYREDSHFGAPKESFLKITNDLKGGHPEALSSLLDHYNHLDVRDGDFKALLEIQTKAGWTQATTTDGKRDLALKTAETLRHRNGSYLMTAELLEGLFAQEMETAVADISPEEMAKIRKSVDREYAHVGMEVAKQIQSFKEKNRKAFAERYPTGVPEEDYKAMVTQAMEAKVALKVRKLAFAKLAAKHEAGQIQDLIADKAWTIYDDLKDPLDNTWNLADESWDRIIDEVVITAITLPITMGVGTIVRSGLSATTLALRWSAAGGMRAFGARAGVFVAGAVTEGIVQEGLSSTLMGSEFQLKNAGVNVLMSGAFHGGGKIWGNAAERLGIDEVALKALKAEGKSIAGKSLANSAGSLATQTGVATGMTYVEEIFHDAPERTFLERLGGSAVRMIGYNFATKRLNMMTGDAAMRAEKLGQARLKHAQKRATELKEQGVSKQAAEDFAVAEAKAMTWDAQGENIVIPQKPVEKKKPLFAAFFEEQAKSDAAAKKAPPTKTDLPPPLPKKKKIADIAPGIKTTSPELKAKIAAVREWTNELAEMSGYKRLQDKGALIDWAIENGMTPEKLQVTRDQMLDGKITFDIENGKAIVKLIPESQQAAQRERVAADIPMISSDEVTLLPVASVETLVDRLVSGKKVLPASDEVSTKPEIPMAARKSSPLKVRESSGVKVKLPVESGDIRDNGQLLGPDGKGFSVSFEESNVLFLGKNDGDGALLVSNDNVAAPQAEIAAVKDSNGNIEFEIRPLDKTPVFVVTGEGPDRVSGQGRSLKAGEVIEIGDRSLIWNPPGSSVKSTELARVYKQYFDNVLLPRKMKAAQDQAHVIADQVEIMNATDEVVGKGRRPSAAVMEYPEQSHMPVKVSKRGYIETPELLKQYQKEGSLRDLPAGDYLVEISGLQRYEDTVARLKKKFGANLEVEMDLATESHFILRSPSGEALTQIVVRGKVLNVPNAAEVSSVLKSVDMETLQTWGKEHSMRGNYAFRILHLLGFEKGDLGSRIQELARKAQKSPETPVTKRAGEELAIAIAYLKDVPAAMEDHSLIHRVELMEKDKGLRSAIAWMKGKNPRFAEKAEKFLFGFAETREEHRRLGVEVRNQVPAERRVPGEKKFDEYAASGKNLAEQLEYLEGLKTVYNKNKATDAFIVEEELIPGTLGKNATGGILGLGVGLVSLLSSGSAHAADKAADVAASGNHSPLWLGVGLGVATLVGVGAWFWKAKFSAKPIVEPNPPVAEKKTAPVTPTTKVKTKVSARDTAKTLVDIKLPLDDTLIDGDTALPQRRTLPNKTPLPQVEVGVPLKAPVVALAFDGEQNRAQFAQNLPTEGYGPHAVATHEGIGRKSGNNQDNFVQGKNYAAVIDGMAGVGGPRDGEMASRIAAKAITDYMEAPGSKQDLAEALLVADQAVKNSPFAAGGAVAVLHRIVRAADGSYVAEIANVGDAGAMVLRPNAKGEYEAVFQTEEQSLVATQRQAGLIHNTMEMRISPNAAVVMGGIGGNIDTQPLPYSVPLKKGDVLLMFSDGIGDNLSKAEFSSILKGAKTPEAARERLTAAALKKMALRDEARTIFADPVKLAARSVSFRDANGKTVEAVALKDLPGRFIDKSGKVYDAKTKAVVDFFKGDNLTAHVYFHDPVEPLPARRDVQFFPAVKLVGDLIDDAKTLLSGERKDVQFLNVADLPSEAKMPEKTVIAPRPVSNKAQVEADGQMWIPENLSGTKLGRHPGKDGILLENPILSREQAEINFVHGEFWLENLSTSRSTRVNGEKLGVGEAAALGDGDLVSLAYEPGRSSGLSFQVNLAEGGMKLTPVLHLPLGAKEIQLTTAQIRRKGNGKYEIQALRPDTKVTVGGAPIPAEAGVFHEIKSGEEVRIGDKVYVFRGE